MKIRPIDPFIYTGIHCPFTGVTIDFEALESGDQFIPEGSIVIGVIDCRGDSPDTPETRSDWFDTRWRDLFEEAAESGAGVDCESLIKAFDFPDGLAIKLAYPESACMQMTKKHPHVRLVRKTWSVKIFTLVISVKRTDDASR
jgi:hypothetical protein